MRAVLSIEDSPFPLVFRTSAPGMFVESLSPGIPVHVSARALVGMQKEALVDYGGSSSFRMASDEGPYLQGTDLAPFPLAFFTAGLQFSLMSELSRLGRRENVPLSRVESVVDSYYGIEGSFLRGDAEGSGRSPDVRLRIEGDAPRERLERLARASVDRFAAGSVMREKLPSTFALILNGKRRALEALSVSSRNDAPSPWKLLDRMEPADSSSFYPDSIEKLTTAPVMHGVEGGAGSSLKAEQKRTLHIHGEGRLVEELLMETTISLRKPIGGSFRFLGDEVRALGGAERAPSPLAYLSAGVAFCYLTQLGRYVKIVKRKLDGYGISQLNWLREGKLGPFDTHVFLEGELGGDEAEDLLRVGERTCFLHASMRGELPVRLVELIAQAH